MNNGQSASKQLENFRPIPGFESEYLISEFGEVWSIRSKKLLSPSKTKDGYLKVALNVRKRYDLKIHRLVALTFLKEQQQAEVNHKDANKTNNHYSNLEWCAHAKNMEHGTNLGLFKSKKPLKNAYKFTSLFTGESFIIFGIAAVAAHFRYADASITSLRKHINTGIYIKGGKLNGLKVDTIGLKDQRLFLTEVDSSESKC